MNPLSLKMVAVVGEQLAIAWEDGVEVYLDFEKLRRACPCAKCQGEPDVIGLVLVPRVNYSAKSFELIRYEEVGGYALRLFWADGHSTGIYSFPLLRSL